MNNKKHTVSCLIGLSGIALALAFVISPTNSAIAQQNSPNPSGSSITLPPNIQQQNPNSMSISSGSQNWTGSISLFSPLIDAFKSKIHTTLNNATTNAITAAGGGSNSSAVAAFIHPERGFLVYIVYVLDPNNNIHKVIIDPGNGKVLSNQLMSFMDMMFMMHRPTGMEGKMMGSPRMMMDHDLGMMGAPHGMMTQHGMMEGPDMGMMGTQDGAWP